MHILEPFLATCGTPPYPPSFVHHTCAIHGNKQRKQMMKKKERYQSKTQGFWRINLVLNRNRTEIRRLKVTNIDYNKVAPFIIYN